MAEPSYRFRLIALLLAAAAVYLAGNGSVALWDRDESRYAQTSRQMLDSGDWIVPRLLDEPREKKPAFIYWCQAGAMKTLGENTFAARLPSTVFVTGTLLLLGIALVPLVGRQRALLTTFIFASSALTIAAAKMCITDGVLICFITAAQLCLFILLRGNWRWPVVIACGCAVGFGLLTKGPVVLGVMAMTVLALLALGWLDRRRTLQKFFVPATVPFSSLAMRTIVAIALAGGIFLFWLLPMERRLPGYTWRTLKSEVIDRATKPQEGHKGPPGYYALTVWGTFFPWSLLLPATAMHAWKRRADPRIRFAIAAVVGPWVMFEAVATKLPHYILPVFPPLAFLTADMLLRAARKPRPATKIPSLRVATIIGCTMLSITAVAFLIVIPRLQMLRLSETIARVLVKEGATHPGDAVMIDYKETSLPFYQGGTIRPRSDNRFIEHTSQDVLPRWIVVSGEIWKATPPELQSRFEIVTKATGLNYADGMRWMDVLVLRKR